MEYLKEKFHVAVPTAFNSDESLNIEMTLKHIYNLQNQGVKSVLLSGSTGEQHSLTTSEKLELLEAVSKSAELSDDFELLFGISSIRQKDAEALARKVTDNKNVKAILVGFPPYILPTQKEAIQYVKSIVNLANKPVILYNNPLRTGFNLDNESILTLLSDVRIIGIKEAGNPSKIKNLLEKLPENKKDFLIYAGGEKNLKEKISLGYTRLSSIWGNLYSGEIANWFQALLDMKEINLPKEVEQVINHFNSDLSLLPHIKQKISENEKINLGVCRAPLGK